MLKRHWIGKGTTACFCPKLKAKTNELRQKEIKESRTLRLPLPSLSVVPCTHVWDSKEQKE